jgi:hypothetical protein
MMTPSRSRLSRPTVTSGSFTQSLAQSGPTQLLSQTSTARETVILRASWVAGVRNWRSAQCDAKSKREDGTFSREDFTFDKARGTVVNDEQLLYRASKLDCDVRPLKIRCCPKEPARKIPRSVYEDARDVVDDRYMGRNVLLVDKPGERRRRSIGRVSRQPLGLQTKALLGSVDHSLGRAELGLPDGARGFDIHDDAKLHIDQIIVRLRLTRAAKTSWLLRRCFQDRENLSGQQGPLASKVGDTPRTFALVVLK